jgi:hypothetical protein
MSVCHRVFSRGNEASSMSPSKRYWLGCVNTTDSSWLNQVEIWFSKVERDVIARGIFTSVEDLARKLRRYINTSSANAKPIQ